MLETTSIQTFGGAAAATQRVAVLDDDIRFIRMVERILKAERIAIQPVTTINVDEALRVIAESRCDAALIDVYMYGSALGFTLIEELRRNQATAALPIIVTSSARREIGRRFAFLRQHHCVILMKPFRLDELVMLLRDVTAPVQVETPQLAHVLLTTRQPPAELLPGGTA
jgi:DNA-binding response OmpR family regulator